MFVIEGAGAKPPSGCTCGSIIAIVQVSGPPAKRTVGDHVARRVTHHHQVFMCRVTAGVIHKVCRRTQTQMLAAPGKIVGKHKNLYALMLIHEPLQAGLVVFKAELFVDLCGFSVANVIATTNVQRNAGCGLHAANHALASVAQFGDRCELFKQFIAYAWKELFALPVTD